MVIRRCYHSLEDYPFYHFSAHVFVPSVNMSQLDVDKPYLKIFLDDVTCKKNITQWDCLLPDWSEKVDFICNGTCIEDCSLKIEANLMHYLVYAGVLILFANITVYMTERWIKLYHRKNY